MTVTSKPPSEIQTLIEDQINGFNSQNTELFLGAFWAHGDHPLMASHPIAWEFNTPGCIGKDS